MKSLLRTLTPFVALASRVQGGLQHLSMSLLSRHPDRATAVRFSNLAWREIEHARFASAIELGRSAIAADPSWRDGYRMLGLAHFRKGNLDQAQAVLQQGEMRIGADPFLLGTRADLEWEQHQYAEAAATYRRALQAGAPPAEAVKFTLNMALAVAAQGQLDEAATLLGDLHRTAPGYSRALLALGDVRLRQGLYRDAAEVFREAIQREPGRARSHYDLGYALAGLQEWRDALAEVRRAVDLDSHVTSYQEFLLQLEQQVSKSRQ